MGLGRSGPGWRGTDLPENYAPCLPTQTPCWGRGRLYLSTRCSLASRTASRTSMPKSSSSCRALPHRIGTLSSSPAPSCPPAAPHVMAFDMPPLVLLLPQARCAPAVHPQCPPAAAARSSAAVRPPQAGLCGDAAGAGRRGAGCVRYPGARPGGSGGRAVQGRPGAAPHPHAAVLCAHSPGHPGDRWVWVGG